MAGVISDKTDSKASYKSVVLHDHVFESAVSVLELLPRERQRQVLNFSIGLLKEDEGNPFRPKTEQELFERIDHSLAQADSGMLQDADEALEEVMEEIGI